MSRSAELGRRDPGFTLIEIVVALGILMVVTAAMLPELVSGIRSTDLARQIDQHKGVAQGQVERMRNLPFHIAPDAGPYVDVLDNFYPNASTTPGAFSCLSGGRDQAPPEGSTGYVSSSSTSRCGYEPPSGTAFYRTVRKQDASGGSSGYTVVTDAQFLSNATPPVSVTPLSGYNSQVTGKDNPPASQIGVTVTVFSPKGSSRRPVSVYTQIAAQPPTATLLRGRAGVRALEVGSVVLYPSTTDRTPLTLSAGLLNLAGSLSTTSRMSVNRGAVATVLGSDPAAYGLSRVESAPPATSTSSGTAGDGQLPQGCAFACWGGASLNSVLLSAVDGLPQAGDSASPVRSVLAGSGNDGFRFNNGLDPSVPSDPNNALGLLGNIVQIDTAAARTARTATVCATDATSFVAGAGYVTTTPTSVTSCAAASTGVVQLFPTPLVQSGLVRIELVAASVSCQVTGTGHAASTSFDYQAIVKYWDNAANNGNGGYVSVDPITRTTTADKLAEVPLDTIAVGGGKHLSDYIASWSSITAGAGGRVKETVWQGASGGVADVSIPGLISISTQPTRTDAAITDPNDHPSVVSLTVGALSCHAEDAR